MFSLQVLICLTCFAGLTFGQTSPSSGPTCSNPSLLMTPTLRAEVLDYINAARDKVKNGQLLLENGQYALVPETMPELSWDCEVEEEMHEIARGFCKRGGMFPMENYTWFINMGAPSHEALVDCGLQCVDLIGHYANYLSQHTIYTGSSPMNYISALHDKAETVACAIYDCHMDNSIPDDTGIELPGIPTTTTVNYIYCKITPDVQFGEKVYEVSPNANANFPSQDVICPTTYGLNIEIRQMILEKINTARQQIQQGTYILQNGNTALQAVNMPNLIWDCDEEAQVHLASSMGCLPSADPETIFQTFIPFTWQTFNQNTLKNGVSAFLDQLFIQNSNLNFLSQTTTYSTQYTPALALSDQATIIACASNFCTDSTTMTNSFSFVCTAKPSAQINDQLYQI